MTYLAAAAIAADRQTALRNEARLSRLARIVNRCRRALGCD
jgi:hypothetical protein